MRITRMKFEIVPFYLTRDDVEVEITVVADSKEFHYKQVYPKNDFVDLFSLFMRDAEYKIKDLIRKD